MTFVHCTKYNEHNESVTSELTINTQKLNMIYQWAEFYRSCFVLVSGDAETIESRRHVVTARTDQQLTDERSH